MKKVSEKTMRKIDGGGYRWNCGFCHRSGYVFTVIGLLAAKAGHNSHGSFSYKKA